MSDAPEYDPKLPCDVSLPPATVLRKGVSLSTLFLALKAGGLKVSPLVADEARADPHVRTIAETPSEVRYGWAA